MALAGTTVGAVSGRATLDPPGLKRFERLQEVRRAAKQAEKKGAPPGGWPLIRKVLAAFEPLEALGPIAKRLDRHVGNIRHIARLLDSKSDEAQVKRVLRTYLNRLEEQAPRRGRGAVTGHFTDHLIKVSNSYWPGLFHTYDDPRIPRTSNSLEGFFGSSKQRVRRTTDRMSTAGGKIDSEGEAIVRVQGLLAGLGATALRALVTGITAPKYQEAKRRLRQIQAPA